VTRSLEADWTWTGRSFEAGVRVGFEGGRIVSLERGAAPGEGVERLRGRALLPGFVNAHSHAFQRGLRGRGERFPRGAESFWTWREAMYELVETLDVERVHELSLHAFREMLRVGITEVGEFHYVHHQEPGDWRLDEAVLRAARDAGIRLVLLQVYYQTGGIGSELSPAQRRFGVKSPEEYWRAFDRLAADLDPATQRMGCVVHSIRAAPLAELMEVRAEAVRRGVAFHMHVEEQPAEIADCVEAYGERPMGIFLARLGVDESFTAVHCTHTEPAELRAFLEAGGNVCVCPLTEANLGDGIPTAEVLFRPETEVSLGTDSNARISFLEEMRWLEYAQRLALERRGVVLDGEGFSARRLLDIATRGGARALGSEGGALAVGAPADFVTVDLGAGELAHGPPPEDAQFHPGLAETLVFGAGEGVIDQTYVAGRPVGGGVP